MTRRPLFEFLAEDHGRLADLLERAKADPKNLGYGAYGQFRAALLRHIAIEEKILLPAARRMRGGDALPIAEKLRRDHGALAALLVPTPTPAILAKLHAILETHNPIEEGPDGVYETCEQLAGDQVEALIAEMRAMPEVKLAPHVDGPQIVEATRRALERAGYTFE
jgi:hypothetical protein